MTKRIKIGIVEDHDMVRQGFVRMLSDNKEISVAFEVSSGEELLNQLQKLKPDLILLDMELPGLHGSKALEIIKSTHVGVKVIVISAYRDEDVIVRYVKLGADSFIPKYSKIETLIEAIVSVHHEGYYFEDDVFKLLEKKGALPFDGAKSLSAKEISILKYLCENVKFKEIERLTGHSIKTIYQLKHRIYRKAEVETPADLLNFAIKHRYLK